MYFVCMVLYQVCSNYDPGAKNGPAAFKLPLHVIYYPHAFLKKQRE